MSEVGLLDILCPFVVSDLFRIGYSTMTDIRSRVSLALPLDTLDLRKEVRIFSKYSGKPGTDVAYRSTDRSCSTEALWYGSH